MAPLEVAEVSVAFGGHLALDGASLLAEEGQVVGLIGPNGAGKTTLFNVIGGLQRPDRGTVKLHGVDAGRLSPSRRARLGLARTFQRLELFTMLSVRDNVQVAVETHRGWSGRREPVAARVDELLEQTGLSEVAERRATSVPTGLGRMVEVARALACRPKVLLLDEPASGQDEAETERFAALLRRLAHDGLTIVLVEHDMRLVMDVCDVVQVLDLGRVLAVGPPDVIRHDPAVATAYLGVEPDCVVIRPDVAPSSTGELAGRRTAEPLLRVRGLRAGHGAIEALHGIDLTVAAGSVHAVLGPNGAGKSTLLQVVAGLHPPTAGTVTLAGHPIVGLRPDELARAGLCLIPEGRGIFRNLTVAENLWMMTPRRRSRRRTEDAAFDRFPRLRDHRAQVAGTLSGGEQQMLAMARGLCTDPALLLVDELSMGLAPVIVEELYGLVAQVAATGVSIVVVEQFARVVLGVADRATLMAHGQVVQEGSPAELEATLTEAYLGG